MKKLISLGFAILCIQSNSWAGSNLIHKYDKFTGKSSIEQKIFIGITDSSFFNAGGNDITLILKDEIGLPPVAVFESTIQGVGSNANRTDSTGKYIGIGKLFLIIDGKKIVLNVDEINYISDDKQMVNSGNLSWNKTGTYERHTHTINFTLKISDELLDTLSRANTVEGSLREYLNDTEFPHNFTLKPKQIKQISEFQQAIVSRNTK